MDAVVTSLEGPNRSAFLEEVVSSPIPGPLALQESDRAHTSPSQRLDHSLVYASSFALRLLDSCRAAICTGPCSLTFRSFSSTLGKRLPHARPSTPMQGGSRGRAILMGNQGA